MAERRKSKAVKAGSLQIGGGAHISVQSMLNIPAEDAAGNVRQAKALEDAGIPMAQAEVTMIPQNYVQLTDETALKGLQRTLDLLDEDDDVQAVYHNWDEE